MDIVLINLSLLRGQSTTVVSAVVGDTGPIVGGYKADPIEEATVEVNLGHSGSSLGCIS